MGIYQLKPNAGEHIDIDADGNSVALKPGQKIETDSELDKMFENKFVRLDNVLEPDADQPIIRIPGRFVKTLDETVPTKTDEETALAETEIDDEIDETD